MTARSKPTVTVENYRQDPLYPRIVSAVEKILAGSKVVAPVQRRRQRLLR